MLQKILYYREAPNVLSNVYAGHLASWPGLVRGLESLEPLVTAVMKEASRGARPSPVSSEEPW